MADRTIGLEIGIGAGRISRGKGSRAGLGTALGAALGLGGPQQKPAARHKPGRHKTSRHKTGRQNHGRD
jgi:hypothetical protein